MVRRGRVITRDRKFAFDDTLRREFRWNIDPNAPICPYYGVTACPKGRFCRDQHIVPSYSHKIVCRHWLRGMCKLGDQCEFLHELDMSRVVNCAQYMEKGRCPNQLECPFRHPKRHHHQETCPAYDKGFCKLGPKCPKPHIRRTMCPRYLTGFCPLGPECDDAHPKFMHIDDSMRITRDQVNKTNVPPYAVANAAAQAAANAAARTATGAAPATLVKG